MSPWRIKLATESRANEFVAYGLPPAARMCAPPATSPNYGVTCPSRALGSSRKRSSLPELRQQQRLGGAARSNSPRCRPSLALWARVSGSSTPVTRTWPPGTPPRNSAMNGIEPPTPMSIGSCVPGLGERRTRRVVGRTGGVDLRAAPRCRRGDGELGAPRHVLSRWRAQRGEGVARVSPGAIRRLSLARGRRDQRVRHVAIGGRRGR